MIRFFASRAIDLVFEYQWGSNQRPLNLHAPRSKSKHGLVWNQDNVSDWNNMSNHVVVSRASTIQIQISVVESGHHLIEILLVIAMI